MMLIGIMVNCEILSIKLRSYFNIEDVYIICSLIVNKIYGFGNVN